MAIRDRDTPWSRGATFARSRRLVYSGVRNADCGSLLPCVRSERPPLLYFDGYYIQCVRQGRWKLHVSRYSRPPWTSDGPRVNLPITPELYDMQLDPAESYECASVNPFIASQMRVRVDLNISLDGFATTTDGTALLPASA